MFKLKYLKFYIKNALGLIAVFYVFDGVVLSNAESGAVGIITYVSSVIIGVALSVIYVDRLWFTLKKHEVWAALVPTIVLLTVIEGATELWDIGYTNAFVLSVSFFLNCQLNNGLRKKDMLQS